MQMVSEGASNDVVRPGKKAFDMAKTNFKWNGRWRSIC